MKWDQAKYDKLRKELAAMENARNEQISMLQTAVCRALPNHQFADVVAVCEQFAAHADALRDALAPFDSGCRAAAALKQEPQVPSWGGPGFYDESPR